MRGRRIEIVSATLAFLCFAVGMAIAQDLHMLLSRFQSERDRATKEALLDSFTRGYPNSGSDLLEIARYTKDTDTRWLAIRGIGWLKFSDATPFLKQSCYEQLTMRVVWEVEFCSQGQHTRCTHLVGYRGKF